MKQTVNILVPKCVCPLCWIAAAVAAAGMFLFLFHPKSPSAHLTDWLKYYVIVGSILTLAWMASKAPALVRHAREVSSKEPAALIVGLLLFGGAPVILLPLMVSAWPILGACVLCQLRQRKAAASWGE